MGNSVVDKMAPAPDMSKRNAAINKRASDKVNGVEYDENGNFVTDSMTEDLKNAASQNGEEAAQKVMAKLPKAVMKEVDGSLGGIDVDAANARIASTDAQISADLAYAKQKQYRYDSLIAESNQLMGNNTSVTLSSSNGAYGVPKLLNPNASAGQSPYYSLDSKYLSAGTPGPWADGPNLPPASSYQTIKDNLTTASNWAGMLGLSSGMSAEMGMPISKSNPWNEFYLDPKLTTNVNLSFAKPIVDFVDKWASGAGVLISGLNASNELMNNPKLPNPDAGDYIRETVKVGVDALALGTEFRRFASFTPVGLAYTGADIIMQNTSPYTLKYPNGNQGVGYEVSGWSKITAFVRDGILANDERGMDISTMYRL